MITTGKNQLDTLLGGGYENKSLNLLISLPQMGRTHWILESVFSTSKEFDTLFISIESKIQDNIDHILRIFEPNEIQNHPMKTLHLVEAVNTSTKTLLEILNDNLKNNIKSIFIDGIDLMPLNGGLITHDSENFNSLLSELRDFSSNHNVPILVGMQSINLDPLKNKLADTLSDLNITKDTFDNIFSIYRENAYKKEKIEPDIRKTVILKDRTYQEGLSYTEDN